MKKTSPWIEVGDDGGEVGGPLQRRARRDAESGGRLGRQDPGECRLAEPGRAGQQNVVERAPQHPGGLDGDAEPLLEPLLPYEFAEVAGSERGLDLDIERIDRPGEQSLLAHLSDSPTSVARSAPVPRPVPNRRPRAAPLRSRRSRTRVISSASLTRPGDEDDPTRSTSPWRAWAGGRGSASVRCACRSPAPG